MNIKINLSKRLIIGPAAFSLILSGLCTPALSGWLTQYIGARWSPFSTLELTVCRAVLAFVGIALLTGTALWYNDRDYRWKRRLKNDYAAYSRSLAATSRGTSAFVWTWTGILLVVFLALMQTLHWSVTFHTGGVVWYEWLTIENGLWETLTALCLFAAGALFILAMKQSGNSSGLKAARWPALLLGLALITGAGEELNWGQHWFGFETPGFLKLLNDKGEANLHNIDTALINHLMVIFFFLYGGLLPVCARICPQIRYVVDRLDIPLAPLPFVPFALIGSVLSDYVVLQDLWEKQLWGFSEARETLFGIIMLGMAILFYQGRKTTPRQ